LSDSTKRAGEAPVQVAVNPIVDKLVLDILRELDINFADVMRTIQADAIYYNIPVKSIEDFSRAQLVAMHSLQDTNLSVVVGRAGELRGHPPTIIILDSEADQRYILEFIIPQVITRAPQLCIIVDDFGNFDGPLLDAFCQLDPAVTFAILPGLPFSRSTMVKATNSGREVIVHIPMEAENEYANPGTNAIMSGMSHREIHERVRSFFVELSDAKGANQHMGSLITADRDLLRASLRYLSEHNLFFIDSRTTAQTVARDVCAELNIPFEERNMFLDSPENSDAVLLEKVRELRTHLETSDRILVITHCHDLSRLERLKRFIIEAKRMGWELVPASVYVRQ
jgi:hypothetical protein